MDGNFNYFMMPCLKNIILLKNISLKIQQTVMKLRLFSEESWKSLISYFMPSFSFVVICYGLHLINFISLPVKIPSFSTLIMLFQIQIIYVTKNIMHINFNHINQNVQEKKDFETASKEQEKGLSIYMVYICCLYSSSAKFNSLVKSAYVTYNCNLKKRIFSEEFPYMFVTFDVIFFFVIYCFIFALVRKRPVSIINAIVLFV
ncbi:hypothetical protein KUTeg_012225 [Tegillarca granosa]|uniref:Uncharacterized protein n=1 Tax=Tegillarca granosa TaxID=220873 RepID=A0ABQ9F2F9_TEGGR|nr:hypothetical protein KUTeg_012225 [Tegillarca granosa]